METRTWIEAGAALYIAASAFMVGRMQGRGRFNGSRWLIIPLIVVGGIPVACGFVTGMIDLLFRKDISNQSAMKEATIPDTNTPSE